eukprot:s472_g15.t1
MADANADVAEASIGSLLNLEDSIDLWENCIDRKSVKKRSLLTKQLSGFSRAGSSRSLKVSRSFGRSFGRSATFGWLGQADDTTSGIMMDFVKRDRARRKSNDESETAQNYLERILKKSKIVEGEGMRRIIGVLQYEQLNAMMMHNVVKECKERGLFPQTPRSSFKQQCKTIHQLKRLTHLIETAVQNWHLTFRLLNVPGRAPFESPVEKINRIQEFWSEGLWRPSDLRLLEGVEDISERRPRYDLRMDVKNLKGRWATAKPVGTLPHQQHEKAKMLTQGGRPEDVAGDGRFPPEDIKDTNVTKLLRPVRQGRKLYFEQCLERHVIPNPLMFMTGHSHELKTNGQIFTDAEMLAALALLREDFPVHELDLAENALLTDKTMVPLLEKLSNASICGKLRRLCLAGCRQVGRGGSWESWHHEMKGALTPSLCNGASASDQCGSRNRSPPDSTPGPGDKDRLADQSLKRRANLNAIVKGMYISGHTEALKEEKMPGILDRGLARAAPKGPRPNLSHIQFTSQSLPSLCKAIGEHENIRDVSLCGTGLGKNGLSGLCLSALFVNKRLEKLDLSWNRFNHEQFAQMGVLIDATDIEELAVDYCAAYVVGRDSPVAELLEGLARDKSLRKLSLVANRVDFRSALVIEDALDMHPTLKDINMTDNPLGALGMRSLLRLLSRKENALKHFQSDGCYQGATGMLDAEAEGCSVYSFTNPGSRYVLDLSRPYHRSLLRILYKTAEATKMPLDKAFEIVEANPPYQHASKSSGLWQVPTSGRLVCNFSVEAQIQSSLSGVDDDDYLGFLDTHFELTRFKADRQKITALFAKWLELEGREEDQSIYLQALAKDFNMSLPYLGYLCRSSPSSVRRTMKTMFPTVPSDDQSRYLAMLCLPSLSDFYTCYPRMEALLTFNAQNATGHYSLDLGNSCEFAVAQRLILLDRWEAVCNKRRQRVDISSTGNRSQLRNENHQGRPLLLRVRSVAEWSLPEYGIFELDYVSCYRPPARAKPLSDELWESLMVSMYNCKEFRPEDKLKALRSISHLIFITCMHMRQMVGYFKETAHREEAFVTFFPRVVDMHNSKQFTVRFDSQEELQRLRGRLGFVTFFPFLQPENTTFVLNLKYNDQRLCCAMLVDLALREKFGNLREYSMVSEDGVADALLMGVPRGWADFAKLPSSGTFRCKYVCAPEDRQVDLRKKLAQTYGFINTTFSESDIAWWTGLNEVGEDVLDLLEFFISRYNHVNEAFDHIDGGVRGADGGGANTTSNGELTLREFEAGIRDIGCHKFKGPNEKERIAAVFRYLDPGGEGNVSIQEWQILDQLWKEFVLSIQEFVQFLIYAFGDELEFAWEELDDDGSGELSEDEWFQAVKRIGYFGPARVVFALLDGSDDGNISWDEFRELEKYRPKKKSRF